MLKKRRKTKSASFRVSAASGAGGPFFLRDEETLPRAIIFRR